MPETAADGQLDHTPAPEVVGISASDQVVTQRPSFTSNDSGNAAGYASRLAGFQSTASSNSGSVAVPTREELMEQGVQAPQADALLVRMNQDEVLMQNFRYWILCFSCVVSMLMPAMVGILIWMVVEYVHNRDTKCDVPLQMWVHVVFGVMVYNSTINHPGRNGSLISRTVCRWRPDPQRPSPMPLRVRIYNAVVALAIFIWTCLGLHWVTVTGTISSEHPPCKEVARGLYQSIKVYAALNLAFTIFMYVNMIGFAQLLRTAMRRGLLHTTNAAPKGALERNTEQPAADDPALKDNPTCSVCLEDFGDIKQVVKTKECGHLFHTKCLQGWLQVNRNCPLCRRDLGMVS